MKAPDTLIFSGRRKHPNTKLNLTEPRRKQVMSKLLKIVLNWLDEERRKEHTSWFKCTLPLVPFPLLAAVPLGVIFSNQSS